MGHVNDGGGKITWFMLKMVLIGKNCLIGGRSTTIPGVIMGDSSQGYQNPTKFNLGRNPGQAW